MLHRLSLILLLGCVSHASAQDKLPADIAAMHKDGKWKIRMRTLCVHLARYNSAHPNARVALKDYLKERIIVREAAQRKISVSADDIDVFMKTLDKQVREATKGAKTLESFAKEQGMDLADLRERSRTAILRERVVRAITRETDKTWPADKKVTEDAVTLAIDDMFEKLPKVFDLAKLSEGVLAKVGEIEVTEYEYGRQLLKVLPITEVKRALQDLIIAEQVVLLTGTRAAPTAEEMESERRAFLIRERNRLARMPGAPKDVSKITAEMINQMLAQRGLSIEKVMKNPGFQAQARARGHFMRQIDQEGLEKFYEENKAKYGDRLRLRRILVNARAQPVMIAGKKIRSLEQGRAAIKAIHLRLEGGEDFAKIAKDVSDDPDIIRKNGGLVPLWLTADAPSYEDSWKHANKLKEGQISDPFFSAGRGYVIVKLLKRQRALGFGQQKKIIRRDAAEHAYRSWQISAMRDAVINPMLAGS